MAHADLEIMGGLQGLVEARQNIDVGNGAAFRFLFRGSRRAGPGREAGRGRVGRNDPSRATMAEDAGEIAPGAALVEPDVDEVAAGGLRERRKGVGIEPVAIDRIAVFRACRRHDQEDEALGLQDAQHLREGLPEEFDMLERLTRDDDVDASVLDRQRIRIRERNIDALASCEIGRAVAEFVGRENGAVAAIDVRSADIEHLRPLSILPLRHRSVAAEAFRHIFERAGMHRFILCASA
jgi:hypothetical protein